MSCEFAYSAWPRSSPRSIFTTDTADARRYRQATYAHHVAKPSYSPAFASIIVDANSGATLTANNPDAIRHPASLTKIMTLYLLFERLEAGKLKLDSEMEVSEHASEQAPTKLGLRPGQTIKVEDAIKGLVTRSANDASVVIAEAIAGDEDDFAKLMTRKARALGMTKTVYRNANGLPNAEQVTTARDQATLGRAIQDRFPRYYRYFATSTFVYRGHAIRNHNRLLGNVEGVDGIKTGYTRASGFNLVTSMRRGNRHLVGVVLGGRSGGSRDAIMRNLLAENLEKGADQPHRRRDHRAQRFGRQCRCRRSRSRRAADADGSGPGCDPGCLCGAGAGRRADDAFDRTGSKPSVLRPLPPATAQAGPPAAAGQDRARAADLRGYSNPAARRDPRFVRADEAGPGEDGSGQGRTRSSWPRPVRTQPATPITNAITPARADVPETSGAVVAKAEINKAETSKADIAKTSVARTEVARTEMPPQPANHGTGNGILGVLPASSAPPAPASQAMAYAEPASRAQPQTVQQNGAIKPASAHTGWIIQVGALESESEARHASKPPAARPAACLPRPSRSPSRWSPRAIGSCSGPALPASTAIRPRRCAGR